MEIKYYATIKNDKLIGVGCCPITNLTNIEISREVFENYEKYIYDGENIVLDPNYEEKQEQKAKEETATLSLTKREVFLALYKALKITPEQIKTQITDPEALIEFEYANEYFRGNPLIDLIGAKLGYTSEDLDYLFVNKELPTKEEPTEETEPSEPTEEAEPSKPTEETEPSEQTEETEPSEPTEETESSEPTEETESSKPTEKTEPTKQIKNKGLTPEIPLEALMPYISSLTKKNS